jgi:D-threo-aldose 1-dehydrogenase
VIEPAARTNLGRTELSVTRVGLGTAPLGGLFQPVDESDAVATVEAACELGLRLFDTAPLYGHGLSEHRLGLVLAARPREEFVLSTKVGRLLRPDARRDDSQLSGDLQHWTEVPPVKPVFDFTFDGVMRSFEESLERLGLDRIDILLIHDPDDHYEEALAGAYRALDRLRSEGAIGAVGAGMNQAEMLVRFAHEADFDCFLVAGRYTLLDQIALVELLPLCFERGIAVILGGVYNSGILVDPRPGAMFDYAPAAGALVERAQQLQAVCRRHGVPLKAAAIQFPLAHPAVTSLLLGARSVAELEENLELLATPVPVDLWEELRRERLILEEAPVPTDEEAL